MPTKFIDSSSSFYIGSVEIHADDETGAVTVTDDKIAQMFRDYFGNKLADCYDLACMNPKSRKIVDARLGDLAKWKKARVSVLTHRAIAALSGYLENHYLRDPEVINLIGPREVASVVVKLNGIERALEEAWSSYTDDPVERLGGLVAPLMIQDFGPGFEGGQVRFLDAA